MFKKVFVVLLCLVMTVLCGCGAVSNESEPDISDDTSDVSSAPKENEYTNPLTGLKNITAAQQELRPYAVMINNISVAQSVQTGLSDADIVYETEVEGGITRLMAVYKDVSDITRLGTIRSARYPYVDLALGLDAIYVHCGQDPNYCKPHLADIDDMSVDGGQGGERISNGLSREHTLYTSGELLQGRTAKLGFETKLKSVKLWANFSDEAQTISGTPCTYATVPFSSSYKTNFKYDETTKLYTRYFKDNLWKDYVTGATKEVTNVFILMTDITNYPDGKHRKVALEGGSGYYLSGGVRTDITWTKGAATNSFTFKDASGNELTVNPGKSWVCIADRTNSVPSFS